MYTTNVIESLHRQYRKITKAKRSNPNFCVKIPLDRIRCFYHQRLAYYTTPAPLDVKNMLSSGFARL